MKNRISFLVIALLVVSGVTLSYAESQEKMLQGFDRDVTKEMPLAEAVTNFNQKYPDANPLTEEEVIASIRGWDRKADPVNDATYALYLRVAEEHVLPPGMHFEKMTKLMDFKYAYEVDWKDLFLDTLLPAGQKDPEIGFGYNYRIRARFISSRPLTIEEKEEIKKANEQHRERLEKEKQKDKNLQPSTAKNTEDKFSLEVIPKNTSGIQKGTDTVTKETAPYQDLGPRVSGFLDDLKSDSWEKVFSYLTPELRKKYLGYLTGGNKRGQLEQSKILYSIAKGQLEQTKTSYVQETRYYESSDHISDPTSGKILNSEAEVVLSYKVKTYYGIQEGVTISNWIKESPEGEWLCTNIGIPGLLGSP